MIPGIYPSQPEKPLNNVATSKSLTIIVQIVKPIQIADTMDLNVSVGKRFSFNKR